MQYCKVHCCRHPDTHVTRGHRCGSCGFYGHGQYECGKRHLLSGLTKFVNDKLPDYLHCTRPNCMQPYSHMTGSHQCTRCGKFHSELNCPTNPEFLARREYERMHPHVEVPRVNPPIDPAYDILLDCPTCHRSCSVSYVKNRAHDINALCRVCTCNRVDMFLPCGHVNLCYECVKRLMKNKPVQEQEIRVFTPLAPYEHMNRYFLDHYAGVDGKVYCQVYAGMGCVWHMRRDGIGELIERDFFHSDDGYLSDAMAKHNKFIEGYRMLPPL